MSDSINRLCSAVLCLSMAPIASWACATCGCTLNADAAMGYSSNPGWRLSFEYDYIHQDQLRSGTSKIAGVPDDNELERETLNRYYTVGLDYSPNVDWNVALRVPYVGRTHSTYGDFDSTEPLSPPSYSRSSSLGDIKLIGSFQGILPTHNLGVQLGIKLPTGRYGTDVKFNSGPLEGEPVDASLQPGTGSTDILVGAYYFQAVSQDFDVFVNAQFQSAIKSKQDDPGNDYRPGNQATISFGVALRNQSEARAATATESAAQERRSGRPRRYLQHRRLCRVHQSWLERASRGQLAGLWLCAISRVQRSGGLSVVSEIYF